MDFSNAARELYGVDPDEFVETRTRLVREAKKAGDAALAKRIGGLRRPTVSAWAVNLLARAAAGDLGRLLDVGDELRAAWGAGGGGLGELEGRRARSVDGLLREAESLAAGAGHPLRDQALREVEDTLQAATVDAEVAAEVRAGTLARPRSHTGFVPAGFPVAPEGGEPRTRPKKEREEKGGKAGAKDKPGEAGKPRRRAESGRPSGRAAERDRTARDRTARDRTARDGAARARRAAALRERAAEAERALAEREAEAASARDAADRASAEVGRLRHELDRAAAARDAAVRKAERAGQARDRADDAARRARRKAADAGGDARGR
ncbi:hypothetical protein [Actinomadura sp. WAC 06369]|uniref:hypothetical protein n=1 Tax=Actinomadura sp. WAC 06369 TaxID=2203193 RepID=UPI000F765FAD|nr:hypothetical protein [Actinomadura sp. WAC 06369]RSN52061.1 hypothetical protein DMH08_29330 [Actinomadura sp. WAC 06369]